MSRLDSFIRRMQAQRDCLNWAAAAIAGRPGVVLELGLGNGRTYDHLRQMLPDRTIYAFDRQVATHSGCIPPPDRLFLGEVTETLPRAVARLGPTVVLVHSDLGVGDERANTVLAAKIGPLLAALLAPDGLVVSDQPYAVAGWTALDRPPGVAPGRYFLYRGG